MKDQDFETLQKILKEESGLVVTPEKAYLLESRLMPIAQRHDLDGLEALVEKVRTRHPAICKDVIEAMTTNETSFYRDGGPFERFEGVVLPYLLKNRNNKKIRIWSAACSSGQEPYSLCLILKQLGSRFDGWGSEISATDLSEEILAQAKEGLYTQFEVQRGLPIQILVQFFEQEGDKWRIKPEIKEMVKFQTLNLLKDFSHMGEFDVVFCRNVLIYFDPETKRDILSRIRKQMTQDGVLFLGGAETVLGICDEFKPLEGHRGVYVTSDSTFTAESAPLSSPTPAPEQNQTTPPQADTTTGSA